MTPTNNSFSLFGSEFDFFSKYLRYFQEIKYTCDSCSRSVIRKEFTFTKKNDILNFSLFNTEKFETCNIDFKNFGFIQTPFWLYAESLYKKESFEQIFHKDIPQSFTFINHTFKLLFCTMNSNAHFTSVFLIDNTFFFFNNFKSSSMTTRIPKEPIITTVFFLTELS